MDKGAAGRPARAEGVWRGRAGRGRGRGPRRQCRSGRAEPGARPRAPPCALCPPCLPSARFLSARALPPRGPEAEGIHVNAPRRPLLTGLRRAAAATRQSRRGVRSGSASSVATGGSNSFFPPPPLLRNLSLSSEGAPHPPSPGHPARVREGAAGASFPGAAAVPRGWAPPAVGGRGLPVRARVRTGCAPAGPRGSSRVSAGAAARPPGTTRTLFRLQVYLRPFQFSVTFRGGETKQKRLYFFSGLVK